MKPTPFYYCLASCELALVGMKKAAREVLTWGRLTIFLLTTKALCCRWQAGIALRALTRAFLLIQLISGLLRRLFGIELFGRNCRLADQKVNHFVRP